MKDIYPYDPETLRAADKTSKEERRGRKIGRETPIFLQPDPVLSVALKELLAEADAVEAAVRQAVREALLMHKRLGNPVASWKDGKVVWSPADQIPVDDVSAS